MGTVLDEVAHLIASKRHIVVLCGAGISTNCGIKDFRSANGLYQTIDFVSLDLDSPEDLFDVEGFRENPGRFYSVANTLFFGVKELYPSVSHRFLKLLGDMNVLLRVYTQNIDGLEASAGVRQIIEAHGSLQKATCLKCHKTFHSIDSFESEDGHQSNSCTIYQYIQSSLQSSKVPVCPRLIPCRTKSETSSKGAVSNHKRIKLTSNDKKEDTTIDERHHKCGGVLKPGITFFGEKLDCRIGKSLEKDKDDVDLLLVIGTSLSVAPISNILSYFPKHIPKILINKTMVQPRSHGSDDEILFDACLLGDCDDIVLQLVKRIHTFLQKQTRIQSQAVRLSSKPLPFISSFLSSSSALTTKSHEQEPICYKSLSTHEKASKKINLYNHPEENIILFSGYDINSRDIDKVTSKNSEKWCNSPLQESVYCDVCHRFIDGTIMTCNTCFDYDVCSSCFPSNSKSHFNGQHGFTKTNL